jgi:hypothetical protein
MDAGHVLLGRLWMFDRKVFHDGRENSYDFFKDGQRYKLVSMLEKVMENSNSKGMDNNNNKIMERNNNKGMDNNKNKVMDNNNNKNMHNNDNQIMLCFVNEFLREKKHSGCCLATMPKRIQETKKRNFV